MPESSERQNAKAGLARGPAELAAAEQMQMQMKNRLAGAAAVVQHRAVAIKQRAFPSELRGDQLQLAKESLIFRRGVVE